MAIKIKGMNNSLVFVFEAGAFEEHKSFLQERFTSNPQLFGGSRVVFKGPGLKELSHEEISGLQLLCLENGMLLNNMDDLPRPEKQTVIKDLVIRRNVRSGQKIRSEGSVLIWGDVHESAEITAAGDIIVLGRLQGIAHAGCYGEMSSIVFALQLTPSQIRIGNRVSRASGDSIKNSRPEIAYWDAENICIREYNSRDNQSKTGSK
ncbi:MAG TPA: septum site-determining protein MinC [Syntrophomonadaceae bacterium]|nr:septum site-determining protein MinC [Syntrophomonadaceae bacterium]